MDEFKVGDQVRITKSSKNWIKSMDQYDGQIVTISKINYNYSYEFENFTGNIWSWTVRDGHFEKVVKPEFVLPEKWCIRQDLHQVVCSWFAQYPSTRSANINGAYTYLVYDQNTNRSSFEAARCGLAEITFEQFQQYVMNPQPVVQQVLPERVFEPLPQFQIELQHNIQGILQVINNEGSTFEINDEVCMLKGSNMMLRTSAKIIRFRKNKAKTDICAVFDEKYPNGISISKLQHYIKPKVVKAPETLMEKAARLYPANTRFRRFWNSTDIGVSNGIITEDRYRGNHLIYAGRTVIYEEGRWAEIIPQEVEETNLEKALRLYPKGVKLKSVVSTVGISSGVVRGHESDGSDIYIKREDTILGSLCVYDAGQNRWAEIIND